MAEESGKGIALVILGIVAILAIVGLVLLFTGARKAATGQFAVPAPSAYGGAIKGVYDPYSRAFSGRAYEYPSGVTPEYASIWSGRAGAQQASYADIPAQEKAAEQQAHTGKRALGASHQFFQALFDAGTVHRGDSCYLVPQPYSQVFAVSDVSACNYYRAQGRVVDGIPAMCNGDISKGHASTSTGYGTAGQGPNYQDPYTATPQEYEGAGCFVSMYGVYGSFANQEGIGAGTYVGTYGSYPPSYYGGY